MAKFHISPYGVAMPCNAVERCPFGGATGFEDHYPTIEEAQAAYERKMEEKKFKSFTKEHAIPPVKQLDRNYRKDDNTILLKKGIYYVGDIGKIIQHTAPELWDDLSNAANIEANGREIQGAMIDDKVVPVLKVDNRGYKTPYGTTILTENGYIGALPQSIITDLNIPRSVSINKESQYIVLEDDEDFSFKNGTLTIGDYFSLSIKNEPVENESTPIDIDELFSYLDTERPYSESDIQDKDLYSWDVKYK